MNFNRRIFQAVSLIVVVVGVFVFKGDAERWCPFGAVESAYAWLYDGNPICSITYANFYVFAGLLFSVLLLRRAFCGYICPIGTISDWLGLLRPWKNKLPLWQVPVWLDRILSQGKYLVLVVLLWLTWQVGELVFRSIDPCYALISRHGEDITMWAYIVTGVIVIASMFIHIPFCRWLCPLGAIINPLSRIGLLRLRRDSDTCIDCGRCAAVCPMAINVDKLDDVSCARCMTCLSCLTACPLPDIALSVSLPKKTKTSRVSSMWVPGVLAIILAVTIGAVYAWPMATFHWQRGEEPAKTASLSLETQGVNCRGSAAKFVWFLDRDDIYAIPGYLRVDAIPSGNWANIVIYYDPDKTDAETIREAITFPYYNEEDNSETVSPFRIKGYAPWDL